jgi:hypothetical protein
VPLSPLPGELRSSSDPALTTAKCSISSSTCRPSPRRRAQQGGQEGAYASYYSYNRQERKKAKVHIRKPTWLEAKQRGFLIYGRLGYTAVGSTGALPVTL